jgi:hypothetical protein
MKTNLKIMPWVVLCLGFSAISGLIAKVAISAYLYEELTHMGDRELLDRTQEQIFRGTALAVLWCGLVSVAIVAVQFFVSRKLCARFGFAKSNLIATSLAVLNGLLLFCPLLLMPAYSTGPGGTSTDEKC